MNQYIIEHPTRGVFVGWKDSSSTGERYPAFNWSKPRNHESTILFDTAEAAFTEIDRMPEGFHRGGIGVLRVPHPDEDSVYLQIERLPEPPPIEEVWGAMLVPIVARHTTIERLVNEANQAIVSAACWRIRQIHPTAAKVVLEHEDDSFYVHHIDLADGTVISGIPDTIDEEDPLEEVQSMVGDLYPLFDMANATTVELDIEENPL